MPQHQAAIVIVSHSPKLASGLQELIQEMARDVAIYTAAGDGEGGLGTRSDAIAQAISQAGAQNVLLFFDIGSALMNTEMAVEMMGTDQTKCHISVVDAPLVEGAFAAAMAIQTGSTISEAIRAAQRTREELKKL